MKIRKKKGVKDNNETDKINKERREIKSKEEGGKYEVK